MRPNVIIKDALTALITQEIPRVLEAVRQETWTKTIHMRNIFWSFE